MLVVPILISVAFITLIERKILRLVGFRVGPNKVSVYGILQPISDAVKLSNKQCNTISNFQPYFYYLRAGLMLFSRCLILMCFFIEPCPIRLKHRILIFMTILGFNSLNSILSGWSTFGKFSLIGRLRTVSQLISYESVLYICLFFVFICYCRFRFFSNNFFVVSYISFFFPLCFYV